MSFPLTDRYLAALKLAFQLHQNQSRKETQVPYLSHLMSVSALVLENGGSEDQAIAALLHDAVEDQGGKQTLDLIQSEFGDEVARIVEGCSDSDTIPKPPWKERKVDFLEKLKAADEAVLLVSLADKLHNARSLLQDLKSDQNNVWEKFTGGKTGTLWYYQCLADIFDQTPFSILRTDLRSLVDEITSHANMEN
jgi:(p)ppGpp synthase/HD superfamily hydrolase